MYCKLYHKGYILLNVHNPHTQLVCFVPFHLLVSISVINSSGIHPCRWVDVNLACASSDVISDIFAAIRMTVVVM